MDNFSKNGKIRKVDSIETKVMGSNRTVIREVGGVLTTTISKFIMEGAPVFKENPEIKGFAVLLPGPKSPLHFEKVKNLQVSCTFLGNNCTTCKHLNVNHGISSNRIYLLGDEFTPPPDWK